MALATVFSSCLGVGLVFGVEPPLIALVLGRSGASSFAVGAVTGASLVAIILLGPFYPRLIARLGLKLSVILGVTLAAMLLAVMPILPGVRWWLALRFLTGCVLGLGWIGSEVWLNSVAAATTRGTVMGIYGTVFSTGTMAGPALLELTGTRGWLPFLAGAACLMLTLLPLALMRKGGAAPQESPPMRGLAAMIRRSPLVMLAAFVGGLIESAELTLLPLYGIRAGYAEGKALLMVTVFMAGNVALQIPIGLLADRHGRRLLLGVCAALGTLGPLLLQPWLATPSLLWPLLFVWGGTLYAFYSQGIALLGSTFSAAELAAANTLFVMSYCLGGVIGPSVGGIAMDVWPHNGLQCVLSGAAAALLAAAGISALRSAAHR